MNGPVATPPIPRRDLAHAVADRLTAIPNATGYMSQIGSLNGLPGVANTPADPPVKKTGPLGGIDLRVRPYFVYYPGVGAPALETDLAGVSVDLDWAFSVTAAAGDIDDLLALVDRIDAALFGWRPGLLGQTGDVITGAVRHPAGYVPPVLLDRGVTPFRHFSPLQYLLTAHT